ncbi:MAG: membrane-binding protein [Intestinibacillus sp.]
MNLFPTLHGVTSSVIRPDGSTESCMLGESNEIPTACGTLIPRWGEENVRRKHIPALTFYPNGALKAVSLEEQTTVLTPLGEYPAEFVTFYASGAVCRVFPVNGKISAYWSEEEERELCPTLQFRLPCGAFCARVTAIHFYESGALRSIALWPGESIVLRTNVGMVATRCGFALYENGALESVEPPHPLPVETPIGVLSAFDVDALGLHGDVNSMSFYPDGAFRSVTTSSDRIEVILPDRAAVIYGPAERPDPLIDDRTVITPLRVAFDEQGNVTLNNGSDKGTYPLDGCCFRALTQEGKSTASLRQSPMTCGDCSTCNMCG